MRPVAFALLVLSGFSGCDAKQQPAGEYVYSCIVFLAPRPEEGTVTATVGHRDANKARALAWKAVCDKLPEADREDCRNERKWKPSVAVTASGSGAGQSHVASITLERIARQVKGRGTSNRDQASACARAVENACQKANAPPDCLASGRFRKKGQSTAKRRSGGASR